MMFSTTPTRRDLLKGLSCGFGYAALAGLADVATTTSGHGVVARIDWARFLPLYQQAGQRAFLAEMQHGLPAQPVAALPSGRTALVEKLTNAIASFPGC